MRVVVDWEDWEGLGCIYCEGIFRWSGGLFHLTIPEPRYVFMGILLWFILVS